MRIAIISGSHPDFNMDGVGAYAAKVYDGLCQRADIETVDLFTSEILEPTAPDENVHCDIPRWNILQIIRLARRIRRINVDVVILQYPTNGYGLSLAICWMTWLLRVIAPKAKLIATLHEFSCRTLKGKIRLLVPLLACHRVVVVDQGYRGQIRQFFPSLAKRCRYVPIAATLLPEMVDQTRQREARERWGIADDELVFCHFGVLRPGKGIEMLLEAFSRLVSRHTRIRLLIVGAQSYPGYFEGGIQPLMQSLRLVDRVTLTGPIDEQGLADAYSLSLAGVFPFPDGLTTRRSSFLAALHFGLPIVTTRPKRKIEELTEEKDLLYVENDPAALADGMEKLILDRGLCQRLRMSALTAREQFSWPHVLDAYVRIAQELAEFEKPQELAEFEEPQELAEFEEPAGPDSQVFPSIRSCSASVCGLNSER